MYPSQVLITFYSQDSVEIGTLLDNWKNTPDQ